MKFSAFKALLLIISFTGVLAVKLRGVTELELCHRHIREARRILYNELENIKLDPAILAERKDNRVQKVKIVFVHFREVERVLLAVNPALEVNTMFSLLQLASTMPTAVINWNVKYDNSLIPKLWKYMEYYDTFIDTETQLRAT